MVVCLVIVALSLRFYVVFRWTCLWLLLIVCCGCLLLLVYCVLLVLLRFDGCWFWVDSWFVI